MYMYMYIWSQPTIDGESMYMYMYLWSQPTIDVWIYVHVYGSLEPALQ